MTEKQTVLTLAGNIDRRTFVRFALYDALLRRRAWRSPLTFALILSAFAAVCFAARKTHAQATLLGGVLLGVGLGLPLVWLGMFFASVLRQARRSGLSGEKAQYVVTLSPEKIHVEKGEEAADFDWKDAHLACRARGCIYLYVSPTRAFLLPDCADSDAAWALIAGKLGPARVRVRTKNS